jgi:hypothetical protein
MRQAGQSLAGACSPKIRLGEGRQPIFTMAMTAPIDENGFRSKILGGDETVLAQAKATKAGEAKHRVR